MTLLALTVLALVGLSYAASASAAVAHGHYHVASIHTGIAYGFLFCAMGVLV